jgi:hypothetical protein
MVSGLSAEVLSDAGGVCPWHADKKTAMLASNIIINMRLTGLRIYYYLPFVLVN